MKHAAALLSVLSLVLCLAVSLCACGKPDPEISGPESGAASEPSAPGGTTNDPSFTIGGKTFVLDAPDFHGDLLFRWSSAPGFQKSAVYSVCELAYLEEDVPLFNIHIVRFANRTVEEVLEGTEAETRTAAWNGLEYVCFDYDENGRPGTTFVYLFGDTTYTISFVSDGDRTSLIDAFMRSVTYKADH